MMNLLAGKNIFNKEKEIFIINGLVNDHLTAPLVHLNSESVKLNRPLLKRLSYFTIECFQNVIRHGYPVENEKEKMTKGMFAYVNGEDALSVYTSNEVPIDHAVSFEEKLGDLKTLSHDDLKILYINTLKASKISDAGGAGLGLIDILRKTKGKVNFQFTPAKNGWSNFMFETIVESSDEHVKRLDTIDCLSFMELNNLILYRQGVISKDGILPISQLISLELQINKSTGDNKYLFAILELIQNVCDHSLKAHTNEDCIFLKKDKERVFGFYTGNLIKVSNVKGITEKLNLINSYSDEEIQNEYERQMALSLLKSVDKRELGLLKIRRKSGDKLQFQFETYSSELSYFYIGISSE
jgi:hypothetical protein